MNFKTDNKLLTTFAFSSLTDIVLLLLIFFLLSSSFIIQPGIKVQLPKAATSEVSSEKNISITVTRDGAYYLDDQKVTLETLPAHLQQRLVRGQVQLLIMKTDGLVPVQNLIEVMDIAKRLGGQKFLIATEKIES